MPNAVNGPVIDELITGKLVSCECKTDMLR